MLPGLTRRLLGDWDSLFPGVSSPGFINYLAVTGSIEGGTTTFLAFTKQNYHPLFAVKVHRHPDAQERAQNEGELLKFLHLTGGELSSSVPRVILCERIAGVWMLVQTIISGHPMPAPTAGDGTPDIKCAIRNIDLATGWLVKLHSLGQVSKAASRLKEEALKTAEEFLHLFDLTRVEKEYVEKVANGLELLTNNCKMAIQHGDFCRHNILFTINSNGTGLGVIDWTDGKMEGFPLNDLFFFLTTYYLQFRRNSKIEGFVQAFEEAFFSDSAYSKIVRDFVGKYCNALKLTAEGTEAFFALFLMERAIFELKKVGQCLRRGAIPRGTIFMAIHEKLDFKQAFGAQFWIHFFKLLVRLRSAFIL